MPDYTYQGAEKAYVPEISKWVEPGETVSFPEAPNNAAFVAASGTQAPPPPASTPEPTPQPQPDAAANQQPTEGNA